MMSTVFNKVEIFVGKTENASSPRNVLLCFLLLGF